MKAGQWSFSPSRFRLAVEHDSHPVVASEQKQGRDQHGTNDAKVFVAPVISFGR
jgi:hypothetical protein